MSGETGELPIDNLYYPYYCTSCGQKKRYFDEWCCMKCNVQRLTGGHVMVYTVKYICILLRNTWGSA